MSSWRFLLLTLFSSLYLSLTTGQSSQFWQRFQRQRVRDDEESSPYLGEVMLGRSTDGQYYPLWSNAAILQLEDAKDDYASDDYAYETPEVPSYTYENDGEEQTYKDILVKYLLRELEKQETLPVVRRRSEVTTEKPTSQSTTTAASTSTSSTSTSVAPPVTSAAILFDRGQKEVPLLRPASENRHRSLSWPQELEKTEQRRLRSEKKVLDVVLTGPKKQPKTQPLDFLIAQLNSLRAMEH